MKPSEAIERLLANGMTEAAVGAAVGVRQSTINKVKRGVVPNWELGQRLIDAATELEGGTPLDRTTAANDAAEIDGHGTGSSDAGRLDKAA